MTADTPGRNVRQRAFVAATELLREEGWEELSVRAIARRAQIGASSIYHHFPNKEALLLRIAVGGFRQLTVAIDRSVENSGELAPFGAAARAFLTHVAMQPALHDLMFNGALMSRHQELRDAERETFNAFAGQVKADSRFRPELSISIATTLWTLGRGMAATALSHPDRELPEEVRAQIAEGVGYLIERLQE